MQSIEEINLYSDIIKAGLCHNEKRWIGFLKSAAYLYKYPFENQISVYGSSHKARADSDGVILANLTACATAEQWHSIGADININAKGISIIKDGKPTEVFDVSDTNSTTEIWQPYDSPDFYSVLARRTRTSAKDLKGAVDECISHFVNNESTDFTDEWTNGRNFQINSIKLIVYTRCGIDTSSIDLSHMNFNTVFGNDSLGIDYAKKYVVSPADEILRVIERSVREYENSEKDKSKEAELAVEEDVAPKPQAEQITLNSEQFLSDSEHKVNGKNHEKKETEKTSRQQPKLKHRSFTHEEIRIARETNLVDFLNRQGEDIKPVGIGEYTIKVHDSMRINGSKFYWNSQHTGGNALDFCVKYYGMSFQDAVTQLLAYNGYSLYDDLSEQSPPKQQSRKEQPKEETKEEKQPEPPINPLPNPLDTKTNRVYAYLTKTRGIAPEIVNSLISEGKIA